MPWHLPGPQCSDPACPARKESGLVEEAVPSRRDLLGKRVVACTIQPWGSLAPVAVGVSMIFEVPDGMTNEEAAGYLIASHTAYHAAIRRGGVVSGETVVVSARPAVWARPSCSCASPKEPG